MNFNTILVILKDSIAGTVIALLTGHPRSSGSMPGMGKKFFLLHFKGFIPALERTQLLYSMCYQGCSPGIKRQGREADHSPQFSTRSEMCRLRCVYK